MRELGHELSEADIREEDLHEKVTKAIDVALAEAGTPLSSTDRARLVREITHNILGYGPIEPFLADPEVTEVMVNDHHTIYVERRGLIEETDVALRRRAPPAPGDRPHRRPDRPPHRRVEPDGRRPPARRLARERDHPAARDHRTVAHDPQVLARAAHDGRPRLVRQPARHQAAAFLEACVEGKLNVLISGGTGTGKTTLLNVLSSFIPERRAHHHHRGRRRAEARQRHVVSLEARPSNIEGKGAITIRDLVRNALRMRPDRIVVGECRGAEALDMLQAMNTGHDGSLTTIHANSPRDALARTETLVLTAGFDLPLKAIRDQIASAFDLIIQVNRLVDGRRRITHITEVGRMEGDVITLQDLFVASFVDEAGGEQVTSKMRHTGIRPGFDDKLEQHGVTLPKSFFGDTTANVDVLRRGKERRTA